MHQRLSLVTLGVADVGRARSFYERLGFTASTASDDTVAFFQLGGIGLALWGRRDLAQDAGLADAGGGGGTAGFGGFALAHNVASRASVDAVLAEAVAAGARLLKPARDTAYGGYAGYFADPDGHPWEIAWSPGFPLRSDGTIELPR